MLKTIKWFVASIGLIALAGPGVAHAGKCFEADMFFFDEYRRASPALDALSDRELATSMYAVMRELVPEHPERPEIAASYREKVPITRSMSDGQVVTFIRDRASGVLRCLEAQSQG